MDQHFPLLDLPKNVLEDVGRLMNNYGRRQLSLSCRKMYHLFDGDSPSLDTRFVVELKVGLENDDTEGERVEDTFEVKVLFVDRRYRDKRRRNGLPDDRTTEFKGDEALENCREFIQQCSKRFSIRCVTLDTQYARYESLTLEELFGLCPEELCDNIRFTCPNYKTHLEHPTEPYDLKTLRYFLDNPRFRAILFDMEFPTPQPEEMDEYIDIVTEWCTKNGYGLVETGGWYHNGFCKVTIDNKPCMVVAVEQFYDYNHGHDDVDDFGVQMKQWYNWSIHEDRWYSGKFEVVQRHL